jgi:hypothetical protein
MEPTRNLLTGVTNIIRFNYGYYLGGMAIIILLFSFAVMSNITAPNPVGGPLVSFPSTWM